MQVSPLLDTESLPAGEEHGQRHDGPSDGPSRPAVSRVQSSLRQLTVTHPAATLEGEGITVHVSFQGFLDALWVMVTEDLTCAPGVVLCNDGLPEELRAGTFFKLNGEVPSMECEVLLGLRDHPLTNLVASTVAHCIRSYGEARAVVMCVSVTKVAKALPTTEAKKAFLALVRETVMRLATGSGEPH